MSGRLPIDKDERRRLRNAQRRTDRARRNPITFTCPASRHLHLMADALASGQTYHMFTEEPATCAETMYSVLESLWEGASAMKTAHILMAQYEGLAVIPLDLVCRDYFRHLTVDKFLRKVLAGEIKLPVVDGGVEILALAQYIDERRTEAQAELAAAMAAREELDRRLKDALAEPVPRVTIYFIQAGDYVKIGKTAGDVRLRLSNLATAHYEELRLLATIPDVPASLEFELHQRFADLRHRGEWFLHDGDLADWIEDGCPLPDEAAR